MIKAITEMTLWKFPWSNCYRFLLFTSEKTGKKKGDCNNSALSPPATQEEASGKLV